MASLAYSSSPVKHTHSTGLTWVTAARLPPSPPLRFLTISPAAAARRMFSHFLFLGRCFACIEKATNTITADEGHSNVAGAKEKGKSRSRQTRLRERAKIIIFLIRSRRLEYFKQSNSANNWGDEKVKICVGKITNWRSNNGSNSVLQEDKLHHRASLSEPLTTGVK